MLSGLCEVEEFDTLTIAEILLCDPGARDGAAGVSFFDDGGDAHQATPRGAAILRDSCHSRLLRTVQPTLRSLRVCPKTSGGITKFSEHEAD